MKVRMLIILSLIVFISCSDDDVGDNVAISQEFFVVDANGNDLLDPLNENKMNLSKMKIYHLLNDGKEESKGIVYHNPNNIDKKGSFDITLSVIPIKKDTAYTIIEWNQNGWITDTIKSTIWKPGGSIYSIMFAFNDSIWSQNHFGQAKFDDYIFTIVK